MAVNTWDDTRIARMAKLWAAGYSAEDIACDLGGITRNAVLGKIHRMGIQHTAGERSRNQYNRPSLMRPTTGHGEIAKRAKRAPAPKPGSLNRVKNALARIQPTVNAGALPAEPTPMPTSLRVPLIDLQPHQCKWPCGDPRQDDFGFCGADRVEGRPYCEAHVAVAYTGLPKVRPERPQYRRAA